MLLGISSKNLFKAGGIMREIENLQQQLEVLLKGDLREVAAKLVVQKTVKKAQRLKVPPPVLRSSRKRKAVSVPQGVKTSGIRRRKGIRVSADLKRGPRREGLSQAIRDVLSGSPKPLHVSAVQKALIAGNRMPSFRNPNRDLSVRMYRIKGVKALGGGMFSVAVPKTRETV
jgi:hypothetical protein